MMPSEVEGLIAGIENQMDPNGLPTPLTSRLRFVLLGYFTRLHQLEVVCLGQMKGEKK